MHGPSNVLSYRRLKEIGNLTASQAVVEAKDYRLMQPEEGAVDPNTSALCESSRQ